ncbi:hypothetical protein V8J36_13315 [Frigidibacter sp. MR17.14]|uniref:hypothetical protein n=1 Tax=Frigidibacter sp. MR17.14 TaxID=3126509 RepID=UPI003012B977
MAFIIKTRPIPLAAGATVTLTEKPFFGGRAIGPDDPIYIWTSETQGGQGLAARGMVVAERPTGQSTTVEVRIEACCGPVLSYDDIRPYRDAGTGSAIAALARKLCRHAHNKIARIGPEERALLDTRGGFRTVIEAS